MELKFLKQVANCDTENEEILKIFLSQVGTILRILPESFGERFWFDAQMISAICTEWNGNTQRLSGTILPRHGNEWAHESAFIPLGAKNEDRKVINVITIPERDDLMDIDLLVYPWICHELAHNVFYYDDSLFVKIFKNHLDSFLRSLQLRALPDQGSAKSKSQAVINTIAEFWNPGLTQKNWAHEMAMDIVALWTCGPAFLATFQEVIEDTAIDPYHVDRVHPPYAVRTIGLIRASDELGWTEYATGLSKRLRIWRKSKWAKRVDNKYLMLAEPRLTEAAVDCTLMTCKSFSLPRCSSETIQRIERLVARDEVPQFGADLIIAAWLVRMKQDEQSFTHWETSVLRTLYESITQ